MSANPRKSNVQKKACDSVYLWLTTHLFIHFAAQRIEICLYVAWMVFRAFDNENNRCDFSSETNCRSVFFFYILVMRIVDATLKMHTYSRTNNNTNIIDDHHHNNGALKTFSCFEENQKKKNSYCRSLSISNLFWIYFFFVQVNEWSHLWSPMNVFTAKISYL